MRLVIVTDAWHPQVNGVVTTLSHTARILEAEGARVEVIHPGRNFTTVPCPSYPSIRLAAFPAARVRQMLGSINPNAIHIATEGPLGWAGRAYCLRNGSRFTTSYHTRYPQYLRARWPIPRAVSYACLRHFHRAAVRTMVATPSIYQELQARAFENLVIWGRGVDTELFRPGSKAWLDLPRPILLYVGRVAVEKNLRAFLDLALPGTKVIIGDGPARTALARDYPRAVFLGALGGESLARHYAAADVLVFPSLTDTFGLVLLEAMASGVPVAAFPAPGARDVVVDGKTGVLCNDLALAVRGALGLNAADCRAFALRHSWASAASVFAANLTCVSGKAISWTGSSQRPVFV